MLKMHVLETVINTIKYITRTYIFQAIFLQKLGYRKNPHFLEKICMSV